MKAALVKLSQKVTAVRVLLRHGVYADNCAVSWMQNVRAMLSSLSALNYKLSLAPVYNMSGMQHTEWWLAVFIELALLQVSAGHPKQDLWDY